MKVLSITRIWKLVIDVVEKTVTALGIIGIMFLTVNLIVSVIFRYILHKPIYFANELSLFLFAWVTFLGGCLGLRKNVLTRFTIILDLFSSRKAKILEVLIQLVILVFSAVVLFYSVIWIADPTVLRQKPSTIDLPIWIFFIILPLSMIFMILFSLDNIIKIIKGERGESVD